MNKLLSLSIPILVVSLLLGLILLNSYLVQKKWKDVFKKHDYSIIHGIDFANGNDVTFKRLRNGTKVWTKNNDKTAHANFFAKYNLAHDKPLFMFEHCTLYVKNPFICVMVFDDFSNDWWRIWEWHWYFFEDFATQIDNGEPIYDRFLFYLEEKNLPAEEVQQAYAEAVKLAGDQRKFARFVFDFIDSHEKQSTIDLVAYAAQNGKLPPGESDWFDLVNHILKFRDDFPDDLPEAVMNKLLSHMLIYCGDLGEMSFSLYNYLLRPTEYNALYAALYETGGLSIPSKWRDDNCPIELKEEFGILHKHGLLEKFLSQVYSDDVETPPLPAPAIPLAGDNDHQGYNIYDTNTYENLPQREKLLKISCFSEIFRTYWQEKLKKLQEKQKAQ
ncbi:MAG: hypothetical protein IKP58_02965 [Victivallales bacterium]|nr:hypothetical protein [Victivallales bacterium]